MPSEWLVRLELLKSEFATIEDSGKSIAEQVANPKIDRVAPRAAQDVAKNRLAQLNEKIASLNADLN
jgi:hypothetical protein